MTLAESQQRFAGCVGVLLIWIYDHDGWTVTFGDAWRPDRLGHEKNSFHYSRLAVDLNLYLNGVYQDRDCPEYQAIGAYWLSLDPMCSWGGAFKTGAKMDLNHYSYGEGKVPHPTVTA